MITLPQNFKYHLYTDDSQMWIFILDLFLNSRPVTSNWISNRHPKHSITKIQLLIPLLTHTCSFRNIPVFHSSSQHLWSNSWCLKPLSQTSHVTHAMKHYYFYLQMISRNQLLFITSTSIIPFGSSHHLSYKFSQEPPNSSSFHLFPTSFSPDIKAIFFKM